MTSSKRLSELYSRVEQDPSEDWTVREMAKIVGTTARTLNREFKRDFGQNPSRYVEERRIALARTYLERTGKSIKEISALSGFKTEQNMRRCFVKVLGILPTEYKERFGQL